MITIIRAKAYLWWSWSRSPSSLHISSWVPPTSRRPENTTWLSPFQFPSTLSVYHQRYHHRSFFGHLILPETKQTKCPRPLCIFEPALVNNKWLAGSQSSNVAAKSKWQDQICPQAPKSAAKALHRVHIFAPKQLAGAPDQNILVENNWEQLSILVEELTALNAGE